MCSMYVGGSKPYGQFSRIFGGPLLLPPSARPISVILCDREWVDDFPPHRLTDFLVESPVEAPSDPVLSC
jgi:hypothetical protein